VRETREYEGGRLPNAMHVPAVPDRVAFRGIRQAPCPAGDRLCELGNRAPDAGAGLAKVGFKEIYHLNGGYRAWKDAGLPVEKAK